MPGPPPPPHDELNPQEPGPSSKSPKPEMPQNTVMPHYIQCECEILTWYHTVLRFMIKWDRSIDWSITNIKINFQNKTPIRFQALMKYHKQKCKITSRSLKSMELF
jgi:hypothetical protein